jgi:hypothetical protein
MKLVKACIAMAAFAALFVVPSVASAVSVTSPTGTVAPVPLPLIAKNVAHAGTVQTTLMKTGLGNVECETATMTGELIKNSGGVVEGNITTAEFSGKPNSVHGVHCAGGFGGDTTVTPNHTTNPAHNAGSGAVSSLPWCLKPGAEDTFTVRGGLCSEATRPLTFTLHTATAGSCSYQRPSVTGTYTTHPADAVATISGQKFTKTTGGIFCPGEGELFMAFTLTTDSNGTPGTPVYIDP